MSLLVKNRRCRVGTLADIYAYGSGAKRRLLPIGQRTGYKSKSAKYFSRFLATCLKCDDGISDNNGIAIFLLIPVI